MTAPPLESRGPSRVAGERSASREAPGLEERWLAFMDVPRDEIGPRVREARRRAARYPFAPGLARRLLVFLIDWLGPLVVLRRLGRARTLSDEDFDRLFRRLREHRVAMIRVAVMFAVMPLMEVVFEDDEPAAPPHPLDGRIEPGVLPTDQTEFDVIVIGSGAGGAPVAAKLAEEGSSVAIVEKGGMVRPEKAHVALEKYYVNQGLVGAAIGTPVVVMAAESIGGTTSVNSGTSLRPAPEQLEVWDEKLGTDFAGGTLDPWLERAEEAIHVMTPPDELRSLSSERVDEGLARLDHTDTYPLPRNIDGCRGSGRCCFGCPTGAKQSTDRS
ncbi:MAG: GMC family oxidoreductase N-terminal domain-containing protein, partial [Persicimonas sp.]